MGALVDILTDMDLPTLYKLTSTGKVQTWSISAGERYRGTERVAYIETIYGLQGSESPQQAWEWIEEGKNLGKANETTPLQQAELEAKSQWEKKVKKGYVQNIEDAQEKKVDETFISGGVEPMLAHDFAKQGHKITYPAYVQPKLDGHRCIAIVEEGRTTLWSRTRKRITGVPHIEKQLTASLGRIAATMPGGVVILDGELYNHDYRDNFQELTSFIRQATPKPGHEVVQYWVYDMMPPPSYKDPLGFAQREQLRLSLKSWIGSEYSVEAPAVVFVDSEEVADEEEMVAIFGTYIDYGFEGLMLRNRNGLYKHGRSYDLQKVKVFDDAEFIVTAVETGKGKMADKAMFVCDAGNGTTFRVKMVGALDDLKKYLEEPERYIGEKLTVKFQGKSNEGIPRFPIALRFREDI